MRNRSVSKMMEQGVKDGVFPGAVLLCAKGRKILFHHAYGVSDIKEGQRMQTNSIFDLASLTKPLATATALSVLIKEGKVFLDTVLKDVIPEVENSSKSGITIDMLLRHTSGLPAHREFYRSMVKPGANPETLLRNLILKEPLVSEPGDCQVYSDLGYMFLSWVIENLSGKRLDRYVREKIYTPLRIKDLFFIDLKAGVGFERKQRIVSTQTCPWRRKTLNGEVEDENAWAAGGIEGHAGLFGDALSVHAMCSEFLAALQHKQTRVIDPDLFLSFVSKNQARDMVAGFDTPSKVGSSSGHYFSSRSIGHLGFTGTSFWIDPEPGLIVILLTNRVHPSRGNVQIKKFRPKIHDLAASCFM